MKNYAAIVYTRRSDDLDVRRFRIIFVLETRITKATELKRLSSALYREITGYPEFGKTYRIFHGAKTGKLEVIGKTLPKSVVTDFADRFEVKTSTESWGSNVFTTNRSRKKRSSSDIVILKDGTKKKLSKISKPTNTKCHWHKDTIYKAKLLFNNESRQYFLCPQCKLVWWVGRKDFLDQKKGFEETVSDFKMYADKHMEGGNEGDSFSGGELTKGASVRKIDFQSQKYFEIEQVRNGLTFIKSPKGTGKTYFLSGKIRKFINNYASYEQFAEETAYFKEKPIYKTNSSVLLMGHRRSLISGICNRLELNCYLNDERYGQQEVHERKKRYGICLDSLKKIEEYRYSVVIIDESEQVLQHFLSSTMDGKREDVFKIFCDILQHASQVILLDADLSWTTYNTICEIYLPEQKSRKLPHDTHSVSFHFNDWAQRKRKVQIADKQTALEEQLFKDIDAGKKVYVTSNSKQLVKSLDKKIAEWAIKNSKPLNQILITSDNTKSQKIQNFIGEIQKEILNYDVCLCSPTLGTGVDITFEDDEEKIDVVYGFFKNRINTHFDIDQQLARVRHPKEVKVWISPEKFNFETDLSVTRHDAMLQYSFNDRDPSIIPLIDMAAQILSTSRMSKNDLKQNFIRYKKDHNWEVVHI